LEQAQARYEARLAARRYEAFDPDNRLVAAELEARWNAALGAVGEVEQPLRDNELPDNTARIPYKETLCSLAQDLPRFYVESAFVLLFVVLVAGLMIEDIAARLETFSGLDCKLANKGLPDDEWNAMREQLSKLRRAAEDI
jgi:hypothetical protein